MLEMAVVATDSSGTREPCRQSFRLRRRPLSVPFSCGAGRRATVHGFLVLTLYGG